MSVGQSRRLTRVAVMAFGRLLQDAGSWIADQVRNDSYLGNGLAPACDHAVDEQKDDGAQYCGNKPG